MPQALSAVYIHLVFSTKNRQPFLRDPGIRSEVHSYLGGISKSLDCQPLITGGVEDHIHMLSRLGRTISQSDWIKELKRNSNLWLKQRWPDIKDFQWQGGYADFSSALTIWIRSANTSRSRKSITERQHFRTNCAVC